MPRARLLLVALPLAARPAAAQDAAVAFRLGLSLRPAAGPGSLSMLEIQAPLLCDSAACLPTLSGDATFDQPSANFAVRSAWRGSFLSDLRRRDWLLFRVRTDEGFGSRAAEDPDAVVEAMFWLLPGGVRAPQQLVGAATLPAIFRKGGKTARGRG